MTKWQCLRTVTNLHDEIIQCPYQTRLNSQWGYCWAHHVEREVYERTGVENWLHLPDKKMLEDRDKQFRTSQEEVNNGNGKNPRPEIFMSNVSEGAGETDKV